MPVTVSIIQVFQVLYFPSQIASLCFVILFILLFFPLSTLTLTSNSYISLLTSISKLLFYFTFCFVTVLLPITVSTLGESLTSNLSFLFLYFTLLNFHLYFRTSHPNSDLSLPTSDFCLQWYIIMFFARSCLSFC